MMVKMVSAESLALSSPAGMQAEASVVSDEPLPVMLEFWRFGEVGEKSAHHLVHMTVAEARAMASMLMTAANAADAAAPVVVAFPLRALIGWAER